MDLLPHRFPMLLVDTVEELIPLVSAKGTKAVTINEPFFQGYFPYPEASGHAWRAYY